MEYDSITDYLSGIGKTLLSTQDMKKKGLVNIGRYRDLATRGLDALIGRFNYVVLLTPVRSETNGHWIIIIRHHDGYEFFDSYGGMPDQWIKNFPPLLSKIPFQFINDHQFQSIQPNVSTCGRWVILRWMFRDISLEDFQHAFGQRVVLTPDQLCTLIVRKENGNNRG